MIQKRAATLLAGLLIALAPLTAAADENAGATPARGRDGTLRIFYWQAPTTMNPYLSGGIKDVEAASPVLEPLARLDPTGVMVPWLAARIPTIENGGVARDLRSVTWRLKPGLTWSDGSPVTSADIAFTHRYCTASGTGCAQRAKFDGIARIDTPDDLTAILRFDGPRPYPYGAFVGSQTPVLQAAQFADCLGPRAASCTDANFAPIGTGPFAVAEFRPNDTARMIANPHYRDPAKPAFSRLLLKGGGDALAAGRAVLETGEFDYAWNLQLSPDVLSAMEARGKGRIVTAFSTLVERLEFNLRAPEAHPALASRDVRHALALALDRAAMVKIGYGRAGRVTCNILPAPDAYVSHANEGCAAQDLPRARDLLARAGWTDSDGDGLRERDGHPLRLTFQTSTNAVRQDFQSLAKEWWHRIGVQTDLRNIDPSVFFGSDPGTDDTLQKFGADIQMYAAASDGPDPAAYLSGWACDTIPGATTGWHGRNTSGWCDPAYDQVLARLSKTPGKQARAALAKTLNDMLVQSYSTVPLVDRGRVSARAETLAGVRINAWDSELWNIADWHRTPE